MFLKNNKYNNLKNTDMKNKITFYLVRVIIVQTFLFIRYLIKNKGKISLLMLSEDFEKGYNIKYDYDEEGYIINTNIMCLIYDRV